MYWRRLDNCLELLFKGKINETVDRPLRYLMPVYCGWNMGYKLSVILMAVLAYQTVLKLAPSLGLDQDQMALGVGIESLNKYTKSVAFLNAFVFTDRIAELKLSTTQHITKYIQPPSSYFHLHREDPLAPRFAHLAAVASSNRLFASLWDPMLSKCSGKLILCKRASHLSARVAGIMPECV